MAIYPQSNIDNGIMDQIPTKGSFHGNFCFFMRVMMRINKNNANGNRTHFLAAFDGGKITMIESSLQCIAICVSLKQSWKRDNLRVSQCRVGASCQILFLRHPKPHAIKQALYPKSTIIFLENIYIILSTSNEMQ